MKLLVSVRNLAEAAIAANRGVDIVDVKEPNAGSLGAADPIVLRRIVDTFSGSVQLSAAQGELIDYEMTDIAALLGYSYLKIGLAACVSLNWRAELARWMTEAGQIASPVAVGYADYRLCRAPSPTDIADVASQMDCEVFLLDTYYKCGQNLFSHIAAEQLQTLAQHIHELGMKFAVAGSLEVQHIRTVYETGADIVGVRGAACQMNSRTSSIDARRVADLQQEINNCHSDKMNIFQNLG